LIQHTNKVFQRAGDEEQIALVNYHPLSQGPEGSNRHKQREQQEQRSGACRETDSNPKPVQVYAEGRMMLDSLLSQG